MDDFMTGLSHLLEVALKNPFAAVVMLVLIVIIIGMVLLNNNFKYIVSHFPTKKIEKQTFHSAVVQYDIVQNSLEDLMHATGCSRVGVRQFSNGSMDLARNPEMHTTLSFLAMRNGVSIEPSLLPGNFLPLTVWSDFTKTMWADPQNPAPMKIDVTNVRNGAMLSLLQTNGVELVYAAPIESLDGSPIGILSAGYLDRNTHRPSDEKIFEEMTDLASRIAGYLLATQDKPKKFLGLF